MSAHVAETSQPQKPGERMRRSFQMKDRNRSHDRLPLSLLPLPLGAWVLVAARSSRPGLPYGWRDPQLETVSLLPSPLLPTCPLAPSYFQDLMVLITSGKRLSKRNGLEKACLLILDSASTDLSKQLM